MRERIDHKTEPLKVYIRGFFCFVSFVNFVVKTAPVLIDVDR